MPDAAYSSDERGLRTFMSQHTSVRDEWSLVSGKGNRGDGG
jgi:hypothetical protein